MKKLLKNKFFLSALAVALALALSTTILALMGVNDPLRNLFGTVTAPVRWCAAKISEGIDGYRIYFQSIEDVVEQNTALKEQNAMLQQQLAEVKRAAQREQYLRDYLALPEFENELSLLDATVIGRESNPYRTTYTLNRGSLHGVRENMPVITAEGVVGRVVEVGLGYCRAESILETSSAVGVYAKRSGADGLLRGDMKLREQGQCLITNIDDQADIAVGDLIVTAGTGSIYPAELVVGVVTELIPDSYSRTVTAAVQPSADMSRLNTVMIVLECTVTPYTYEDIDPEAGQPPETEVAS